MVDTLKFLKMGDDSPAATAVIGELLRVEASRLPWWMENWRLWPKPEALQGPSNGMLDQYRACPADPDYPIALAHADSPEGLNQFVQLLRQQGVDCTGAVQVEVGTVIGAHAGAGCE